MKSLIVFTICLILTFSCKVSDGSKSAERKTVDIGYAVEDASGSASSANSVETDETIQSLSQYLRRVPGVRVSGDDFGGTVRILGGSSSIAGGQGPLFVVNGTKWGHSLPDVARRINVHDIEKITVLKTASETAIWGSEGANGVIVIRMKK